MGTQTENVSTVGFLSFCCLSLQPFGNEGYSPRRVNTKCLEAVTCLRCKVTLFSNMLVET